MSRGESRHEITAEMVGGRLASSVLSSLVMERFPKAEASRTPPLRPEILESWRRSLLHGLTPANAIPRVVRMAEAESQLRRAAYPLLDAKRSALSGIRGALTLTDAEGRLLGRWVEDPGFARRLDVRLVVPGRSISESDIGTSSASVSLDMKRAAVVVGPEHFSTGAVRMTSAGAPVRHPITSRIIGTLNFVCAQEDTNQLLLPWVSELVAAIERRLLQASPRTDRLLFEAFLTTSKDARHPVICLNKDTVITNAAASRLLDTSDHALVWEVAARAVEDGSAQRERLVLSTGSTVDVSCVPVQDDGRSVGALLHLASVRTPAPQMANTSSRVPALTLNLPGRSLAWTGFVESVRRAWASSSILLIVGESGTGKSTIATALAESSSESTVLDVLASNGLWVNSLRNRLQSGVGIVVLRRIDQLDPADSSATAEVLRTHLPRRVRVIATARASGYDAGFAKLMEWPGAKVIAPPLRDRLDDLPDLLSAMTRRQNAGVGAHLMWSREAIQLLSRMHWPANLHSLDSCVTTVLQHATGPIVLVRDLPREIVACGNKRSRRGLEQVEADAIIAALYAAQGNKRRAADALGIARSSVYRKMRALGLDLGNTTF